MKTKLFIQSQQTSEDLAERAYQLRLEHKGDLAVEKEAAFISEDALWTLALRYAHGIGVEKNAKQALEYLYRMSKTEHYQEILLAELYVAIGRIEIARDIYYCHFQLYDDAYAAFEFFKTFIDKKEIIPSIYLEEVVEACEKNCSVQYMFVADLLINADYGAGNYIKAFILFQNDFEIQNDADFLLNMLETAAQNGCRRALNLICVIASKSNLSIEKKLELFENVANRGEADGVYYYAKCVEDNCNPLSNCSVEEEFGTSKCEPPQRMCFAYAQQLGSLPALYRWVLQMRKEGIKEPEKFFRALKTVAESKKQAYDFNPVAACYLLGEAYQYGIGTKKDIDTADVWYERVYKNVTTFFNWLNTQNGDKERKKILRNLFAHEKRYRLFSRERLSNLPQWMKRFDQKLWRKYIAYDTRFKRAQAYIQEAEKYPDHEMPYSKKKVLKRALRLGNGAACDSIENYYSLNKITDAHKRIKNLKKGVKMHNPFCMFHLGYQLSKSEQLKNRAEGAHLMQLVANRGIDLAAIKNLSLFYEHGTGVEKDFEKYLQLMTQCFEKNEIKHFIKSDKILRGFCSAIGYAYFSGSFIKQDIRKAVLWFRKGADLGCGNCMKNLGWLYYNDDFGRESDGYSRRWMDACTKREAVEDNTYTNLGYFYHYGVEGEQNFSKAIKNYRAAYDLFISKNDDSQNANNAARAAFNLGVIYSQQLFDFENAVVWYKKALALKENFSTLNNLANCYTELNKPDIEAAEAIFNRILETAPQNGYMIGYAYSNLADNAISVYCKESNYEKARALKKRAIQEMEKTVKLHESGADVAWNDSVYANLANAYLKSVLIKRNPEKAQMYAVKGAKLGHYEAQNICKKYGFKY